MPEFAFQGTGQRYRLTENALISLGAGREILTEIPLKDVTRMVYKDVFYSGIKTRNLLVGTSDHEITLKYAHPASINSIPEDLDVYFTILAELSKNMSLRNSGQAVVVGERHKHHILLFILGVIGVLGAIGLMVGAAASGVSTSRMINMGFPIAGLGLFGAIIAWSYSPWRKLASFPVQALGDLVAISRNAISGP